MGKESRGGEDTIEYEKRPLSWYKHLQFLMGVTFSFTVFTLVVSLAIPRVYLEDKVGMTMRYGLITAIEIIIVLVIQVLVDMFFEEKKPDLGIDFKKRAGEFGLRKPRNAKATARDTALLLFCALVPLDFLTYVIPGVLEYVAESPVGSFFSGFSIESFIAIGLVYNLITGIKEEYVFRGYFLSRLKEKGSDHSAWLLSALFFASLHVQLSAFFTFPAGPVLWFVTALLVGLLFGGYYLNVNRMLPIVLAHGLGNFISAFSILAFTTTQGFQGDTMLPFLLTYYGPMLIAGAVLAIVFHRFIKRAFFASKRLMGALKHRTVPGDALIMLVMFIILVLLSYFLIF